MSSTAHGTTPYYFVPHESRHPVMAAIGLFFVILGAGQWINGESWGMYSLFFGLIWWLTVLYQWFKESIAESEGGQYGRKIDQVEVVIRPEYILSMFSALDRECR